MIKVEAVESNNRRRGCVVPMIDGAIVGSVAGFGLKYLQPVTPDEKQTPEYKSVIRDIKNKQNVYSSWTKQYLDGIKSKDNRSVAEDVFVKMYDGIKDGEKIGNKRILKAFHEIQTRKPEQVTELKELIRSARTEAERIANKYINSYNLITKHIRPTSFFVGAGAVVGAFIVLMHEVLRTDVKH